MGEMVSSLDPVSDTDMEQPKAPSSCSVSTLARPAPAPAPSVSSRRVSLMERGSVEEPENRMAGDLDPAAAAAVAVLAAASETCAETVAPSLAGHGEEERHARWLLGSAGRGWSGSAVAREV